MRKFWIFLATAAFLISTTVQAQSGGGDGGGPSPYAKLETISASELRHLTVELKNAWAHIDKKL